MHFRPSNLKLRGFLRPSCAPSTAATCALFLLSLILLPAFTRSLAQEISPTIGAGVVDQDAGNRVTEQRGTNRPTEPNESKVSRDAVPADSGIETLYVRDESGELVPILNLTYEDFVRLYQIDRGLDANKQAPTHSIENLTITGEVVGNRAELNLEFQIKLSGNETAKIPLRLNGAVLREPAKYTGKGEHVLAAAGPDGGYICWLKGKTNTVHKTTIKVIAPVVRVGNERRISLALPTATASSIKITVPEKGITATVSPTARIVKQENTTDKNTRDKDTKREKTTITVAGAKGDFQLEWSTADAKVAKSPLLLEAASTIQVRVKGPGAVSTLARIRVSSSGRELDTVQIRLPADCKPVAVADPRYTTEFVTPPATKEVAAPRPVAVVKFTEPTAGPIDIQLAVEQSGSAVLDQSTDQSSDRTIDVLGFEVIDALRHFGTVSLIAEGDWLVRTTPSNDLRRLGDIPDAVAQDGLVAAFEYYRQPASLPIKVLAKETRLNVEPTYLIDVQSDEVVLTAILDCHVVGAPAFALRLDMSEWDVQKVGQPNLVQQDDLRLSEVAPLEIPLATAMRGEFEIRVVARRPIPKGADTLPIRLPVLMDASATAAVIVVNPADNLSITARQELDTDGPLFDPEPLPTGLAIPIRTRTPLCYRYRGDPAAAKLVYDFGRREQSTSVIAENSVRVEKNITRVEQLLTYDVLYQPMTAVALQVPRSLVENKTFRIMLDGEELTRSDAVATPDETGLEDSDEIWTIPLRSPRLGKFELQARYELPWSLTEIISGVQTAPYDATLLNTVRFVRPKDADLKGTTIRFSSPEDFTPKLSEFDYWAFEDATNPPSEQLSIVEYRGATCPRTVAFEVQRIESSQAAVIDGLFAQTWLTANQRQDRVATTISGATFPLRVRLPKGALTNNLKVLVDGFPVATQQVGEEDILINPPTTKQNAATRLELVYRFASRSAPGKMEFALPEFEDASWVQRFYWQVVMPEDEHLLTHGKQVTSDHIWQRRGLTWQRTPRIEQAQLESFAQATKQAEPGTANNHYLFAGFGETPRLELQTASRRWLLLVSSGCALGLAFLWQALPWFARRWALIPLFLTVCAAAWLTPGPAVIVAQAAVLGLGLAIFARLLDWMVRRRTVRKPVRESRPHSHSHMHSQGSATLIRGSSIAKPRSTDSLPLPATGRQ